jgi:putative transposase
VAGRDVSEAARGRPDRQRGRHNRRRRQRRGKREGVGLHVGASEAEAFWSTFLKSLARRGLRGVKLVIYDAHEGLKGAIRRVMGATWQRCRVHWMRNAFAYVPRGQQTIVAAAFRQAFLQSDQAAARQTWRHVAEQFRPRWPKLAAFLEASEHDVLAYMGFPAQHRQKLHSTNTIERLNKEVKRRADVVGIFPVESAIIRLIGAVLLEANYEWATQHRYMASACSTPASAWCAGMSASPSCSAGQTRRCGRARPETDLFGKAGALWRPFMNRAWGPRPSGSRAEPSPSTSQASRSLVGDGRRESPRCRSALSRTALSPQTAERYVPSVPAERRAW